VGGIRGQGGEEDRKKTYEQSIGSMAEKEMQMKLVDDWENAWRWFSVWCLAASGAAPAAWLAVPADMRDAVPATWLAASAVAIAVLGLVGRIVDQDK